MLRLRSLGLGLSGWCALVALTLGWSQTPSVAADFLPDAINEEDGAGRTPVLTLVPSFHYFDGSVEHAGPASTVVYGSFTPSDFDPVGGTTYIFPSAIPLIVRGGSSPLMGNHGEFTGGGLPDLIYPGSVLMGYQDGRGTLYSPLSTGQYPYQVSHTQPINLYYMPDSADGSPYEIDGDELVREGLSRNIALFDNWGYSDLGRTNYAPFLLGGELKISNAALTLAAGSIFYLGLTENATFTYGDANAVSTSTANVMSDGKANGGVLEISNGIFGITEASTLSMAGGSTLKLTNGSFMLLDGYSTANYFGNNQSIMQGARVSTHGPETNRISVEGGSTLRIYDAGAFSNATNLSIEVTGNVTNRAYSSIQMFVNSGSLPDITLNNYSMLLLGRPGSTEDMGDPQFHNVFADYVTSADIPSYADERLVSGTSSTKFNSGVITINSLVAKRGSVVSGYGHVSFGDGTSNSKVVFEGGSILRPALMNVTVGDSIMNMPVPSQYRATNTAGAEVGVANQSYSATNSGVALPAGLCLHADVVMQSGSTLQLVAFKDDISTLYVYQGSLAFQPGATLSVIPLIEDGVRPAISGFEAVYAENGMTGIEGVRATTVFGAVVSVTADPENPNLMRVWVNRSPNPSGDMPNTHDEFINWTLNDVMLKAPQYLAPRTKEMIDALYIATGNPFIADSRQATVSAYNKINPITIVYSQHQAQVVEDTIRTGVLDRLSAQRPNAGISALSRLYGGDEWSEGDDIYRGEDEFEQRFWNCETKFWGRLLGNWAEMHSDVFNPGYEGRLYGVVVGAEQRIDSLTRGLSLAYTHSTMKNGERDVQNYNGTLDSVNMSFYGSLTRAHFFMDGVLGYTFNRAKDSRDIFIDNRSFDQVNKITYFNDQLSNDFDLHALSASARVGAMYYMAEYRIMPSIGLDYTYLYRTRSADTWASNDEEAFTYDSYSDSRLNMPLQLSVSRDFLVGDRWLISPELRMGWAHLWTDDRAQVDVGFSGLDGTANLKGMSTGRSTWFAGIGVAARWQDRMNLIATYDYRYQRAFRVQSFTGGVDWLF